MKITKMQKVGVSIIIICALAIAILFITNVEPIRVSIEPITKPVEEIRAEEVSVGYGWSIKDNAKEAVQEAVSLMKAKLGEKSPEYVILFSTVGYDSTEVLKEVRNLLPNTQIYGGTSMLATLTKDGFHEGGIGSLALMGISSPKIDFGVGGADVDQFPSARDAGKSAVLEAIKNAKKENETPQLIAITGSVGNEEALLQGIEDIVGKSVPIIGGSSGDNDLSGKWKQFANDKVYSNGVSLTVFYTDLKVAWAYEAGYIRSKNKGIITKAEGRIIYEIDNKPASEVYNEWAGGIIDEELETGGSVLSKTAFYPLAKIIPKDNEIYYLSIHPLSVNLPEKSLTVFTNVEEGDEILLMRGTWELLLNRAQTTPYLAMASKNIDPGDPYFGIYTYCAGTMLAIPEEERSKIPLLINKELGNVPFIGTFTFGEQGPLGEGNYHGNLVNSMVVFAPKEE